MQPVNPMDINTSKEQKLQIEFVNIGADINDV